MIPLKYLFASVLLAAASKAQTPSFISPVVLEPGKNSGKCLTAQGNWNGAPVTIQGCNGNDAQQWTFNGGSVKIFGNKCLDVKDGQNRDGTKLQIWDCFIANTNQQFWFTGDLRLAWTNHGKCVDLTDGNQNDGNAIQVWTCGDGNMNQVWNAGYHISCMPKKSQDGQTGTNACGSGSDPNSQCQTAWINDVNDFCLFGLPNKGSDTNRAVVYCKKDGHGSRVIPNGALQWAQFGQTGSYVQITGGGDFTKLNFPGDDHHFGFVSRDGQNGISIPIGGLVYGNTFGGGLQYHEWNFWISSSQFCFRACTGPNAQKDCSTCG